MKIAFTICSYNYLSQALLLANSVIKYNPEYRFILGLVDKPRYEINLSFLENVEILYVNELGLDNLDALILKYNIVELNTSVKASYFKFLFRSNPACSHIHYFDPDIMIFSSFEKLDHYFSDANILLTPHILEPILDDDLEPRENMFLNYGIYNLGYIGLKNTEESYRLLDWWEAHTLNNGYMNVRNGYFVDQLWMNHAPLFFKGVHILREKGFNCAPWNVQERKALFSEDTATYCFDDESQLTFYHFSSYNPLKPNQLSSKYSRNTFENRPEFKPLYDQYAQELLGTGYLKFKEMHCALYSSIISDNYADEQETSVFFNAVKGLVYLFIPPIFISIFRYLKSLTFK